MKHWCNLTYFTHDLISCSQNGPNLSREGSGSSWHLDLSDLEMIWWWNVRLSSSSICMVITIRSISPLLCFPLHTFLKLSTCCRESPGENTYIVLRHILVGTCSCLVFTLLLATRWLCIVIILIVVHCIAYTMPYDLSWRRKKVPLSFLVNLIYHFKVYFAISQNGVFYLQFEFVAIFEPVQTELIALLN